MREINLFLLFLTTTTMAVGFSAGASGKTSVCPNEVTPYYLYPDHSHIIAAAASLENGVFESTGLSYMELNYSQTVDVRWSNTRGTIGKVRVSVTYEQFGFILREDNFSMDVIIGSPELTGINNVFVASCEEDRSAFSILPVRGATSYSWSNSLGWSYEGGPSSETTQLFVAMTSATSGTVSVTAINSNCPSTNSTFNLPVTRTPSTSFLIGPDVIPVYNAGDFNTVRGTNMTWTAPAGWTKLTSDGFYYMQLQAPSYSSSGYLSVTYNDACGVEGSASKFVSTEAYDPQRTAPSEDSKTPFTIYPNPAINTFNINTDIESAFEVSIADNRGNPALSTFSSSNSKQIDISGLKAGDYVVKVKSKTGTYSTHLIVKKN